LVVSSFVYNK